MKKKRSKAAHGRGRWALALAVAVLAAALAIVMGRPGRPPSDDRAAGSLRIVSLAPSVTETLFAMGLGDCVVGATDFCDHPPEAKAIRRVGGLGSPNIETLLALRPDLVITTYLERRDSADVLRQSGIRLLEIKMTGFEAMFDAFFEIAQATGDPSRAEKVVAAMRAKLNEAAALYEGIPRHKRPRVFIELHPDPLATAGAASFIDEVVERAGGVNVAHDLSDPYPRVSPESVIEWNPDVIFVCYMNPVKNGAGQLARRIGWQEVSAIKQGRIIDDIPPDLILRPGPRLADGVVAVARRLYGH